MAWDQKSYYASKAEKGQCRRCTEPHVEGKKFCQYHLDYAKKKIKESSTPEQKREWGQISRDRARQMCFDKYGLVCACCGESEPKFLTFDHADGSGAEWRRLHGSGSTALKLRAQGFPEGFRTLCANCNLATGIHGQCPHGTLAKQRTNHPTNRKAHGDPAFADLTVD